MSRHTITVSQQAATCCDGHTMPKVKCSCGWAPRCYPGFDAPAAVLHHRISVLEQAAGLKVKVDHRV